MPYYFVLYNIYNLCTKGAEQYLQDRCGHLIYDVMSPDLHDVVKYPNVSKIKDCAIEVIQEQGQVVFVPSGWHHQVYNLVSLLLMLTLFYTMS